MRNLKRTLSLLLAAIMLIGMMVVGASAADVYDNFTDKDEIVNKDAVNLLTILDIINGKEDGSHFDPKGGVTRAEMAKMIAVVLNRGRDNNDLYKNANTGLTDIKGNWAEGNINFCYQRGIIAGRGDGRFDPTAPVTASEAAKMLLVAAGYDADIEGYVGANWSMNVNIRAAAQGIYNNYTGDVMANLSRDDAALLIYNALDVEMIESYTTNNYAQRYEDYRTILSSMYGVYKMKGVVIGNEWAQLENTGIDDALAEGRTKVAEISTYTSNTQATNTLPSDMATILNTTRIFNISTPVNYMGKTVTMYIRKTTVLNDYEVLGVYLREIDNDIITKDASQKISDAVKNSGLKVAGETEYYVNYGVQKDDDAAKSRLGWGTNKGNGIDMELIDNDKDGIVDYVLYLKRDLTVVNTSRNDIILRGFNDNKAIDEEDIVTDLDLAADDVVLAVTYGGRYYVEAPEVVTGVMTAYNSKGVDDQSIDVDGVTYKPSAIGKLDERHTSANGVNNIIDLDINLCEQDTGVQFKTNYEFFLDTHGYIRAFRPTEESLPNYALVLESGYNPGVYAADASGKVTVLLSDGTEATYSLNFSASASNLANQLRIASGNDALGYSKSNRGVLELKSFLGTDYTDNSLTRPWRYSATSGTVNYDSNATGYQFAFKGTDATSETTQARETYRAGKAAGYVISYTLNSDDVLTIKNIIGSVDGNSTVAPNYNNYRLNDSTSSITPNLGSSNYIHTLHTDGGTLSQSYNTGDATVYGGKDNIAIDRNTIAFYYADADNYGVAVGYHNMANVDHSKANNKFLASTVITPSYNSNSTWTYTDTHLADVILFNQCNLTTSRNYVYVLSANTTTPDYVTLNVVFENGEIGTLKLKSDHYDDIFNSNKDFEKAYAYSIGSNDFATLSTGDAKIGNGYRLKVGTVSLTTGSNKGYYPYNASEVNIWDVTDLDAGDEPIKLSDFSGSVNDQWGMILILDSTGEVRTAFVDEDATTPTRNPGTSHTDHDWNWADLSDLEEDYEYYGASTSTAIIQRALNNGHDVVVGGGFTLTSGLTIPADRILRVEGGLDVNNQNLRGDGYLMVDGDLDNTRPTLSVGYVIVNGEWTLTADTTVSSKLMYAGTIGASSNDLNVASGADLHVGWGSMNAAKTTDGLFSNALTDRGNITGLTTDTITVSGHLELANGVNASGATITVNSTETLIVHGDLTIGTLNVGSAKVGTTAAKAGSVTVNGKLVATDVALPHGDSILAMNGAGNEIDNNVTGVAGAQIVFGADATMDDNKTGGLTWSDGATVEGNGEMVKDTTFTFGGDNEIKAEPDTEPEVVKANLSIAATSTLSDYVVVADTNPTTVTFKETGAEGAGVDNEVTLTNNGDDFVYTVGDGEKETPVAKNGTLKLAAKDGVTTVIKITVKATDKQNVLHTITVENGEIATAGTAGPTGK